MREMGFGKKYYELTFVHKLAIVTLAVLGLLMLCDPFIYRKELTKNLPDIHLSFLQAGDYVLELEYRESPADNAVIVWSDSLTGADNQPGAVFARQTIEKGEGSIRVGFHLDQGTHNVQVGTALDGQPDHYFVSAAIQRVQLLGRDRFF